MRRWLLPEHLEDILPPEARAIERLRRTVLDYFNACGYELVIPPMLEYLDSLLSGTGHDLDLATFKLVDQLSGRMMGIRADHTPQVTRIDAHLIKQEGVTRLCYCGSVLHTLPASLTRTREPLQIGAELYGHAGIEADIEIQQVMVESLKRAGIPKLHVDIGHPVVFRALLQRSGLDEETGKALFDAIEKRDGAAVAAIAATAHASVADGLTALPSLLGDVSVLDRAQRLLPEFPEIAAAFTALRQVARAVEATGVSVSIDLAELGGFAYESGMVFAAFTDGFPDAIARGGRYDEVGSAFGRPRAATGLTLDIRQLARVIGMEREKPGILAPWSSEPSLLKKISDLRDAGEVVMLDLPGHEHHRHELHCDRQLSKVAADWRVLPLTQHNA